MHKNALIPKMRYPASTPLAFTGAPTFVTNFGNEVWFELCDTVPTDEYFNVTDVAKKLNSLKLHRQPERHLRAVLAAIIADYNERPDDYEFKCPIKLRGQRMDYVAI